MTKNSTVLKVCGSVAVMLAVAACGGGSGGDSVQGISGNSGTNTGGSGSQDSFFALVLEMVASSPDNVEPKDIDAITVTSPQNAEPSATGS